LSNYRQQQTGYQEFDQPTLFPLPHLSNNIEEWASELTGVLQDLFGSSDSDTVALPILDGTGRVLADEDGVYAYTPGTDDPFIGPLLVGIDTQHLVDAAVNTDKLATNAVESSNLAALSVVAGKLAVDSVTATTIKALAVGTGAIQLLAVGTAQIDNLAVQEGNIKDLAVTNSKILNLTASKLTAGVIDASIITVNNLSASNITTGSMSAGFLLAGSISVDEMGANSVTATELNVASLSAISADLGTITAGSLSADRITTGELSALRIDLDGTTVEASGTSIIIKNGGVDVTQLALEAPGISVGSYSTTGPTVTGLTAVSMESVTVQSPNGDPILFTFHCNRRRSGNDADYSIGLRKGASTYIDALTSIALRDIDKRQSVTYTYFYSAPGTASNTYHIMMTAGDSTDSIWSEEMSMSATVISKQS